MSKILKMNTITASELKRKLYMNEPVQLIDVREPYEHEDDVIGGVNIPMDEVSHDVSRLKRDVPVVLYCNSGKRSGAVLMAIEKKWGLENCLSLEGGAEGYNQ